MLREIHIHVHIFLFLFDRIDGCSYLFAGKLITLPLWPIILAVDSISTLLSIIGGMILFLIGGHLQRYSPIHIFHEIREVEQIFLIHNLNIKRIVHTQSIVFVVVVVVGYRSPPGRSFQEVILQTNEEIAESLIQFLYRLGIPVGGLFVESHYFWEVVLGLFVACSSYPIFCNGLVVVAGSVDERLKSLTYFIGIIGVLCNRYI